MPSPVETNGRARSRVRFAQRSILIRPRGRRRSTGVPRIYCSESVVAWPRRKRFTVARVAPRTGDMLVSFAAAVAGHRGLGTRSVVCAAPSALHPTRRVAPVRRRGGMPRGRGAKPGRGTRWPAVGSGVVARGAFRGQDGPSTDPTLRGTDGAREVRKLERTRVCSAAGQFDCDWHHHLRAARDLLRAPRRRRRPRGFDWHGHGIDLHALRTRPMSLFPR